MTGALIGLVVLYGVVIFIGKRVKLPSRQRTLLLAILAAMQVAAVLYFVFTMPIPATK